MGFLFVLFVFWNTGLASSTILSINGSDEVQERLGWYKAMILKYPQQN